MWSVWLQTLEGDEWLSNVISAEIRVFVVRSTLFAVKFLPHSNWPPRPVKYKDILKWLSRLLLILELELLILGQGTGRKSVTIDLKSLHFLTKIHYVE